nr:MAG TPA: hypothetical protein [Crassvirales sp.]
MNTKRTLSVEHLFIDPEYKIQRPIIWIVTSLIDAQDITDCFLRGLTPTMETKGVVCSKSKVQEVIEELQSREQEMFVILYVI